MYSGIKILEKGGRNERSRPSGLRASALHEGRCAAGEFVSKSRVPKVFCATIQCVLINLANIQNFSSIFQKFCYS